jgi:ABC-2 type transport system ATP-binding protein
MLPIDIKEISKTYTVKRGRKVLALDKLTLHVGQGEVLGFLGPNGSGKSTTIKTLVGQIRATQGTASIFGLPVSDSVCRQRVGYLPENPAFYDFLSSHQYLELVGSTFGMNTNLIRTESNRVLDLLDLHHADRRPIRSYSKGMVQRLGLAQALLHDPDLYILDEPMSGLDPLGRALVKQIIADLKRCGKTVFFSTHVTADVEAVCDRVAIIDSGKLLAVKQVSDLLEKGIEGYDVQLAGGSEQLCQGFDTSIQASGVRELFVPRGDLNHFMAKVARDGGEILLMEPRRRNLEQFFLDIVQREKA